MLNRPSVLFCLSRLSLVSLVVVTIAGCSVGREVKSPDLALTQVNLPLDETTRFTAAEPVVTWWRRFEDDLLTELVQQSLETSYSVRIAAARLAESRALYREVRKDYYPTVESEFNASERQQSRQGAIPVFGDRRDTTYELFLDASWEIDLWGAVRSRVQQADLTLQAQTASLQDAYVSIAAEVSDVYTLLRGAQYRLDVALRNASNQEDTYELTQTRVRGGTGTSLDTARALAQLQLTLATIPPLRADVNANINRLNVLTGGLSDNIRQQLADQKDLPEVPVTVAVGDMQTLIRRRRDIRQAELTFLSSVAEYNVNVADLYPRIDFLGSIGYLSTTLSDLTGSAAATQLISGRISWPALNLGRVRARIAAADARTQLRLAEFEQTLSRALEEIDSSMVNFNRQEERRQLLQLAREASADALSLAERRFEAGIDDFLDVLDAQRSLLQAEDQLAQSDIQVVQNLIAVYRALGGGWQITSTRIDEDVADDDTRTLTEQQSAFLKPVSGPDGS